MFRTFDSSGVGNIFGCHCWTSYDVSIGGSVFLASSVTLVLAVGGPVLLAVGALKLHVAGGTMFLVAGGLVLLAAGVTP